MYKITLIPGDGIGPEIVNQTIKLFDSVGVAIDWDVQTAGIKAIEKYGTPLPKSVIDSVKCNKVALKGPIATPIGDGFRSVNVLLRKELDLYTNLRLIKNYPGVPSKYENVDLVIVRENTEDLYIGIEHMVGEDAAESIKIFTKKGCERIIRFAFEYAIKENRKKVTAVHKANIMKLTDGMFLNIARNISLEYPDIEFEEMIIDAMCMKLVQEPETYDVLVLPNLYGDIVSDLCAGLVGGLGFAPGVNIANPTALILSGIQMLKHLGEYTVAMKIENALIKVLSSKNVLTRDIGGDATTSEFVEEIIFFL